MKVAVTVEQSWHRVPGGTAWAALELLRALAARDDVDVIGVAARHTEPPPEHWRVPVPVRHLPLPRLALYESWHTLRRPRIERATGPVDLVHATAIAWPPASAPVVVSIYDLAFLHDPTLATRHGNRFFRRGTELARRHARLVMCPSQATIDDCITAGFDRDRLRLVPLGIRDEPADAADVERARKTYGLDRPYVLFVGTIEPRKNLGRLVDAFAALDQPDVDLVLVGPEGWNEDLDRRLSQLGQRVHWLGFVAREDLHALLAGAAVFAYPSTLEGFGLPVLEAMAQGTAVVTSRGTSTEEVVGDAGLAVDPLDVSAIAGALDRLLSDPGEAARLGAAGQARASTFTWERTADLTVAAYREALAG